jgi:hypothetical protein
MRIPRLRFTMRRLIAVVTLSGLASAWAVLWWRSLEYQRRAEMHQRLALFSRRAEVAVSHSRMASKYWKASQYPWLSVAPEPH